MVEAEVVVAADPIEVRRKRSNIKIQFLSPV